MSQTKRVTIRDQFFNLFEAGRDQYIGKDLWLLLRRGRVSAAPPEGAAIPAPSIPPVAPHLLTGARGHLDASGLPIGKPGGWHR